MKLSDRDGGYKISKENEESFPEEEIPRNKMIKYLETLPEKKQKIVVDLPRLINISKTIPDLISITLIIIRQVN